MTRSINIKRKFKEEIKQNKIDYYKENNISEKVYIIKNVSDISHLMEFNFLSYGSSYYFKLCRDEQRALKEKDQYKTLSEIAMNGKHRTFEQLESTFNYLLLKNRYEKIQQEKQDNLRIFLENTVYGFDYENTMKKKLMISRNKLSNKLSIYDIEYYLAVFGDSVIVDMLNTKHLYCELYRDACELFFGEEYFEMEMNPFNVRFVSNEFECYFLCYFKNNPEKVIEKITIDEIKYYFAYGVLL